MWWEIFEIIAPNELLWPRFWAGNSNSSVQSPFQKCWLNGLKPCNVVRILAFKQLFKRRRFPTLLVFLLKRSPSKWPLQLRALKNRPNSSKTRLFELHKIAAVFLHRLWLKWCCRLNPLESFIARVQCSFFLLSSAERAFDHYCTTMKKFSALQKRKSTEFGIGKRLEKFR